MCQWIRIVVAAAFAMILSLDAIDARAAPPSNDDIANATVITDLPFTDSVDTTEATTEATDPNCFGNGPTVWYEFTSQATTTTNIIANTFTSDYDTTLSVYQGGLPIAQQDQIACNDDSLGVQSQVTFEAVAGETYFIMVGAFGSGSGGNLNLTVEQGFDIENVTISNGSVSNVSGAVTLQGTVQCSSPGTVDVSASLTQRQGRRVVQASGNTQVSCGETPTSWSMTVSSPTDAFRRGRVEATLSASGCGESNCDSVPSSSTTIMLR